MKCTFIRTSVTICGISRRISLANNSIKRRDFLPSRHLGHRILNSLQRCTIRTSAKLFQIIKEHLQLLLQDSQTIATNANMVAVLGHFCRFAGTKAFDTRVEEFGDGLGILRRLYRVCIGFSGGIPIEILYKPYTRSKQSR
jgi:hypothetical protein